MTGFGHDICIFCLNNPRSNNLRLFFNRLLSEFQNFINQRYLFASRFLEKDFPVVNKVAYFWASLRHYFTHSVRMYTIYILLQNQTLIFSTQCCMSLRTKTFCLLIKIHGRHVIVRLIITGNHRYTNHDILIHPVFFYRIYHRIIYRGRKRHLCAYNFPPVTPLSDLQHPK